MCFRKKARACVCDWYVCEKCLKACDAVRVNAWMRPEDSGDMYTRARAREKHTHITLVRVMCVYVQSGADLDVFFVRIFIIFNSSYGLLHLAEDHVQMLVVCLRTSPTPRHDT